MSVYMVAVKPELIAYEGPGISFKDEISPVIRAWAWEQGFRYFVRQYKIEWGGTYHFDYALGFTDRNAAFAYKMRFG